MPKRAVFERSRRELSLDVSFGVHILLVVEQSSLESQSRVCQNSHSYGSTISCRQEFAHSSTKYHAIYNSNTLPVQPVRGFVTSPDRCSVVTIQYTISYVIGGLPKHVPVTRADRRTCAQVNVACSVSEDAHACHPHASHISEETSGRVSFADISQQLNVSDSWRSFIQRTRAYC